MRPASNARSRRGGASSSAGSTAATFALGVTSVTVEFDSGVLDIKGEQHDSCKLASSSDEYELSVVDDEHLRSLTRPTKRACSVGHQEQHHGDDASGPCMTRTGTRWSRRTSRPAQRRASGDLIPRREQSLHQPAMHRAERPDLGNPVYRLPDRLRWAAERRLCGRSQRRSLYGHFGRVVSRIPDRQRLGVSGSIPSTMPARLNWRCLAPLRRPR